MRQSQMKKIILLPALLFYCLLQAQQINTIINATEVERIERILSSDSLRGRKVFTPDIEKAADFIINEFKKNGLVPLKGAKDYRQTFDMLKPKLLNIEAQLDGADVPAANIAVISPNEEV